jgi:hypothetical protein
MLRAKQPPTPAAKKEAKKKEAPSWGTVARAIVRADAAQLGICVAAMVREFAG